MCNIQTNDQLLNLRGSANANDRFNLRYWEHDTLQFAPVSGYVLFSWEPDTKDQFLIGLFAVKLLFKGIITESFCNQKANNINIILEKNKQKPLLGWKKESYVIEDF